MVEQQEDEWPDQEGMDWSPSPLIGQIDDDDYRESEKSLKRMKLEDVKPTVRSKIQSMQELFEMD